MGGAVTEEMRHIALSLTTDQDRKTLLKNNAIQNYITHLAIRREHEQLKNIRNATEEKYGQWSLLSVPVEEGQLLSMFLKTKNPKKTLEIGVFTGYSLLVTALALQDDAHVTAVDHDKEAYEVGLPFIQKAGVAHKINFIQSNGIKVMDQMVADVNDGKMELFDFIFVDADKMNYKNYHKRAMELVKIGGVIAYDNTLWEGYVAEDESQCPEKFRPFRKYLIEFNDMLAEDTRIEVSMVTIGDGITFCRRIV